ncbi:head protein [Alteromonas phage vB_AmeM_PT11-V22]|uniref:Uncharacterized protein n=1 Tax=Alteromonas phage vB_AmeM_PT11-V22 TaxID=2704031 RepID=A0A6C0R2L4_9CAUD|nr:head protein [Alteromonas phage vB_AmeM_PT11-V22]QHZ59734.1 hypothetical protein [Alteromonas phage vB_AmeM_PT11-V22]
MIDLMRTHSIPLYRRSEEEGYLNNEGEWVQAQFKDAEILECNVQPLRDGKTKVILPDGVRTDHVIVIRSFTRITVADMLDDTEGDEVEYQGKRFEAFKEEDFSEYGLMSDHYKYLFKRKDQQ